MLGEVFSINIDISNTQGYITKNINISTAGISDISYIVIVISLQKKTIMIP